MGIIIPLVLIFFTCLLIWRACDGFEIGSEYIGRNLSEGVRGGTINAISSSIPELLTTLIALFVLSDKDGFAVGIGTTAGSALFNGMIIPAVCILTVVGTVVLGTKVLSVNVAPKVILRDGLCLIAAELLLILCLGGTKLVWWQGALMMSFYIGYLFYMISSMKRNQAAAGDNDEDDEEEDDDDDEERGPIGNLFYWLSLGPLLDLEGIFVKEKHKQQIKDETWNGWPILIASTAVIAVACYFLVKACEWLGSGTFGPGAHEGYTLFGMELSGFQMPALFVAVIFASMATSVPDTVISVRDAKDGDYDDAVANALGSNIFDICFALGFPLFLFTLIHGSIEMSPDVVKQSSELRAALLILTVAGFCLYFFGKRETKDGVTTIPLGKNRAFALLGIYFFFVVYIVASSQDAGWAASISDFLRKFLEFLPQIGS